ncbi:MAG TPA: hypothetical protein VIJ47_11440 [Acidimicrobiales bacterium]
MFAADGIWRAWRSPAGPATVQIVPGARPGDAVTARAWGPGGELALDLIPDALGFHDDPIGFVAHHPIIREQHRRHPGLRLGRTCAVVEALLPTIVAQKVPAADASRSWQGVRRWLAEPAPGPARLTLPPDPERLAVMGYADLHRFGIDRKRAEPLLAACRQAARLDRLGEGPVDALVAGLTQLPGVGPWTASSVAVVALGDPDTIIVGDYGIPSAVAWVLAGERRADDARMLALLEPERPQRARAIRLLATTGRTPPRHGPRLRPASISRR